MTKKSKKRKAKGNSKWTRIVVGGAILVGLASTVKATRSNAIYRRGKTTIIRVGNDRGILYDLGHGYILSYEGCVAKPVVPGDVTAGVAFVGVHWAL